MTTRRAKKIVDGERRGDIRLDVRQRHPSLLRLEGWYEASMKPVDLPSPFCEAHRFYVESGARLKFTRWCARNRVLTQPQIALLGQLLEPVTFKVSCRHNDLLRLADTKHYKSCFSGWRGKQQLRYLSDPDIGVVFVPDASGKFLWRALCRLVRHDEGHALVLQKRYGNTNRLAVYDKLNSMIPLFLAPTATDKELQGRGQWLSSVTRHNNAIVGKHVWSDHKVELRNSRLHIYAVPYPRARDLFIEYVEEQ